MIDISVAMKLPEIHLLIHETIFIRVIEYDKRLEKNVCAFLQMH